MTIREFSEEYGIYRTYVASAIDLAGLDVSPSEVEQKNRGPKSRHFRERDIAQAVIDYFGELHDNHIVKARLWDERAAKIGMIYKERNHG